ncbi:MAG TPA: hypothetical protein VNZ03_35465 [Terriglobales bacterium]|jgi:hypothetical protein|nr:hypothetical protein [Terriglobales bacterium]
MGSPKELVQQPSLLEKRASLQRDRSSAVAWDRSKRQIVIALTLLVCAMIVSSSETLFAQTPSASPTPSPAPPTEPDGVTRGGYQIHSSVEVGYRSTDVTGSGDMYDTLVNLQSGPRILDQTLTMQSVDHQGLLFDDLYLSSFGWGGDPNNALRLRADKNKWYNLQGSFRRDQSFFDYDLLANPLNPPPPPVPGGSSPSIPILNSPHEFATTRRMTDVDLTLLSQSRVSFRLGYSHNNMTGPSYSSIHEGTEGSLFQDWNTTINSYRLGVDFRIAPRTVLSYDQFLDYYKGDTDYQLNPLTEALLPTAPASSVSLGLSIDTLNKEPCAIVPPANSLILNGTLTNVACSAYFNYSRNQRIRTTTPTERVSLRSNYFQRVDLVASFSYSSATSSTPLDESFGGLITRSSTLAFLGTGTAAANRISDVLDLGATMHLTKHLRLIETFYFWAYRIPENGNFSEVDNDCIDTKACTLLTPLSATAPTTVPTLQQASFNQTWTRNQTELAWDISKKVGARIGYRYGDRKFNHFLDYLPGDVDHFVGLEKTALLGLWARPTHALRLNFDFEHTNYNAVFVRLSPRKEARYRFQTTYTPRSWVTLGGSINILQESNDDIQTQYVGHNQNYGLTASLAPRERFGMDLAYNFNSVIQNALICFNDTPPPGVILPFVANANGTTSFCALNDPGNPLLANSYYTNHTNFGMAAVRFKPTKRVLANVGYSITSVDGSVPQFNILQPLGSLQYKYQQPVANLSVDIGHKLAFNMGWNYYQYGEGSFVGPTAPRYFHANSLTESLRYAF